MTKSCVRLAALTALVALVVGGWSASGAVGASDLATVSDREAAETYGGQTGCVPGCWYVSYNSGCDYTSGYPKVGYVDYCPYAPSYYLTNIPCGGTAGLVTVNCTNACGNLCGGSMTSAFLACGSSQ